MLCTALRLVSPVSYTSQGHGYADMVGRIGKVLEEMEVLPTNYIKVPE